MKSNPKQSSEEMSNRKPTTKGMESICQHGQCLAASTELTEVLHQVLVTHRIRSTISPAGGFIAKCVEESLLLSPENTANRTFPYPNAGLVPIIGELASRLQIKVSFSRPRLRSWPQPCDTTARPQLYKFLANNSHGVVTGNLSARASTLSYLMQTLPDASIIVIGHKKNDLRRLRKATSDLVEPSAQVRIGIAYDGHPFHYTADEPHAGLIFSTMKEVANLDFSQADFVFFANANECTHRIPQCLTLAMPDCQFRLFGFDDEMTNDAPYEVATKMRVFGPAKLSLGPNSRVLRPVGTTHPPLTSVTKYHDMQKHVWRNRSRNEEIAEFAKEAVVVDQMQGTYRTVAVLADNLVHAAALSALLPDWRLRCSRSLSRISKSVRDRVSRQQTQWDDGLRSIVVLDGSKVDYQGWNADVLIWAGSTPNIPSIPQSWLFQEDSSSFKPLLIMDFKDQFSGVASSWDRARKRKYAAQDIFECGIKMHQGRTNEFLLFLENEKRKVAKYA